MADIIVGIIIAVAFVLALRKTVRDARNGGGCAGCSGGSCSRCGTASIEELNSLADRLAGERKAEQE